MKARDERLRVDPIACRAHGLGAEMLPELIELDEWGDPIVDGAAPVRRQLYGRARAAARACPTLALRLAGAERSS